MSLKEPSTTAVPLKSGAGLPICGYRVHAISDDLFLPLDEFGESGGRVSALITIQRVIVLVECKYRFTFKVRDSVLDL